jgi:hypothetical protein
MGAPNGTKDIYTHRVKDNSRCRRISAGPRQKAHLGGIEDLSDSGGLPRNRTQGTATARRRHLVRGPGRCQVLPDYTYTGITAGFH